ncbi:MAG: hypothetical protein HY561_09310 [Gemmatimonadetes bacterium]|nr:hypothetical protein [Gemmatimonadota bacterium]
MQRLHAASIGHGVVGGLVAGAVVALWFFVLDVFGGEPLHTPRLLASVLLGDGSGVAGVRLIAAYTMLHFGVFAFMGAAIAGALALIGVAPGLVVGVAVALGVLDAVYYGALLTVGANLLTLLPGVQVLLANLFGAMAMMMYLHRAEHAATPLGPALLRQHRLLAQGILTGLVGAGAVALWFLFVDVLQQQPFYTPAALGSLVLLGARGPDEVQLTLAMVAAYTVVHVVAFAEVGVLLVWAAERLEQSPGLALLAFMAFVILEGLFLIVAVALGEWILGRLSWWAIGIGNLIGVAAMGRWVWQTHPRLRQQFLERPVEVRL